MANILILPLTITHETEKAVLIVGDISIWLPKSQITIRRGYVFAVAGWLYKKYKPYFRYANDKTIEELEEWLENEIEVAKLMAKDPTLRRCVRCGCLFHGGWLQDRCSNCDVDYTIALGHSAKFGAMSSRETHDAAMRGIIHTP
ncbi:MAG: hypothetical protein LBP87_05645 [Planctomycetaceae bacterium]|jgi:hypothetical protein|nr:hypothetical protein [Planctomycetaceae bacterium]